MASIFPLFKHHGKAVGNHARKAEVFCWGAWRTGRILDLALVPALRLQVFQIAVTLTHFSHSFNRLLGA